MPAKLRDSDDWFNMWFDDRKAMMEIMVSNMMADLEAGYDYFGKSIVSQREALMAYKLEFDKQMNAFAEMTEAETNRWCFYDMKRRGVIE